MPALALLAVLAVAADGPADFVWLEGEAATVTAPLTPVTRGPALSSRRWLTATRPVAAGGATAGWPFAAPAAGRYDMWMRVGFAGDASPVRWRVAGRAWVDVPGDAPPHDPSPVDDIPVGWVKAGSIDLAGGPHTLELNLPATAAPRFALDAVCLVRGTFYPDGPFKPGTGGRTALDWEAARRPFEFPPPAPGQPPHARRVLVLAGTWQATCWDEIEVADRLAPVAELPADLDARPWRGVRLPGELADARPDWAYCHRYLLRTRFTLPSDPVQSVTLRLPNAARLVSVFVNGKRVGASDLPHAAFACDLGAAVKPGANELVVAVKDHAYAVEGVTWAKLRLRTPDRTRRGGLLEAPTLTLAGPAFVADVFARPQVAAGRLALDVTVRNPTDTPQLVEVRPVVRPTEADGRVIGGTPAKSFAAKSLAVPAGGEATVTFDDPWPNPRPWWPDDPVRYAVETTLSLDGRPADEQTTRFGFREWGAAGGRLTLNGVPWKLTADDRHAGPQPGPLAKPAVKDWRAAGVSLFRYAGERPWTGSTQADTLGFFDAAGVPVLRAGESAGFVARVRAERNSPAVAAWELPPGVDVAAVRAVDPTRPTLPASPPHVVPRPSVAFGGAAFAGGQVVADRLARELAEADRWRGVMVSRFVGDGPAAAWQPVCVLVKERETTVPAGRPLVRTLRLFNDTRVGSPITVHWLFRVRGSPEVRGKRVLKLAPGGSEEFPLTLAMPTEPADAELVLSCERDGREVFRDVRALAVVGP